MNSKSPSYHGYRFPPEIISHAVWLYHRFCMSFRDVRRRREGTSKWRHVVANPSLPKYKDWAHYDEWLGMNGARILMEMMMGY